MNCTLSLINYMSFYCIRIRTPWCIISRVVTILKRGREHHLQWFEDNPNVECIPSKEPEFWMKRIPITSDETTKGE